MASAPAVSRIAVPSPARDLLYVSKSKKTFSNDESLPSLPVPPLGQTIEKYLDSVKPVVTEEEYKNTEAICREFLNGIGKELQMKLLQKANHQRNWLEKWWEELAYLQHRTPLLPQCSMAGFTDLIKICPYEPNRQIKFGSLYLYFQLCFWNLLRKELLRPHYSQDTPWSMHQFRRLFNTVRIPGEVQDKIVCYFHPENEDTQIYSHVVVLHRGHIFTFDVLDENGEILTPPELALQMQRVKDWAKVNGEGSSVSSLTLAERSEWAKNLEWLLKIHPENAHHMETIYNSIMIVSLDEAEPKDLTESLKLSLTGDGKNRWPDKSVDVVFFENGAFGMITDHSPFDGLVPVAMGHYCYMSVIECGGEWKGSEKVERQLMPPRRIDFHIDNHIKSAIEDAQEKFRVLADDVDINRSVFRTYGKSFMKTIRIHPETYVQMALQYAYFTMHGRFAPTYVTASTRQFYHGRTETLRSCFPEVTEWVSAMVENTKSVKEKQKLLHVAAEKFRHEMKDAMRNNGCDRHFLGLYMISQEEELPVPEIFMDPSWIKSGGSGNFILSTSCSGYTPVGGGVMAMREDGYGTFYSIEDDKITFTITGFKHCPETSTAKFYLNIERALLNMENLLTSSKL